MRVHQKSPEVTQIQPLMRFFGTPRHTPFYHLLNLPSPGAIQTQQTLMIGEYSFGMMLMMKGPDGLFTTVVIHLLDGTKPI